MHRRLAHEGACFTTKNTLQAHSLWTVSSVQLQLASTALERILLQPSWLLMFASSPIMWQHALRTTQHPEQAIDVSRILLAGVASLSQSFRFISTWMPGASLAARLPRAPPPRRRCRARLGLRRAHTLQQAVVSLSPAAVKSPPRLVLSSPSPPMANGRLATFIFKCAPAPNKTAAAG